ncbi:DUF6817 domain-containing protein [[Pseudomonas] boreopolis]|uniref:DUF6817 domain-containing protein n=1 Tax=Xanthomonas boreopolis TaxID=86183 RepID=UPI003D9B9627
MKGTSIIDSHRGAPDADAMANLDPLLSRLVALGADRVGHSGRRLIDHLTGTARLLELWECEAHVRVAGLFHSIYGTNAFVLSCMERDDRERLRSMIGTRAEFLVFLFCTSHRPDGLLQATRTGSLVDRVSGEARPVSIEIVQELLEIECANLLEQHGGHRFLEAMADAAARGRIALKPRMLKSLQLFLDHVAGPVDYSNPTLGASMRTPTPLVDADAEAQLFAQRGYLVIRNLLSRRFMEVALRYYLSYLKVGSYYGVDERTQALDRYADAFGEALFPEIQPVIEQRIGKKLLPTYSFARIYTTESRLSRHVDRGACEISATLTVGFKSPVLWPIFVHQGGRDIGIDLDVGDALIYRGMDLPHWREPLDSGFWCQLFFHFVDAEGALTEQRFDGRGRLGPYETREGA